MAQARPNLGLERTALVGLFLCGLFGVLGALMAAVGDPLTMPGLALANAALAAGLLAAAASMPLDTLRMTRADTTGGTAYDRLRGQRTLRVASALLGFLVLASALMLALYAGAGSGVIGADLDPGFLRRGLLVFVAAIAGSSAVAHLQSLRTPVDRDRSAFPVVVGLLCYGLGGAALVISTLGLLAELGIVGSDVGPTADNGSPFLLAGFILLGFGLARIRTLPGVTQLMAKDEGYSGRSTESRRNAGVMVPAVLAFALLLVIFLLFLLFGIGVGDLFVTVGQNPLLLGVLLFLLLALGISLGIGMALARSAEKEQPLFKVLLDPKQRAARILILASFSAGATLLILAALSFTNVLPHPLWLHLLCLGLMVMVGPYGFYAAHEHNRIRRLEERFPDFLRDIASSHRGGLTLHQSVTIAARGDYGPLTPEVRKMADQLSWNVSFQDALNRFAERVKTPLVQRAASLILEADRSGGATTDVLLAAARDAREIKNLENERRLTMSLYTIVVYITFFVFLGVAAVLYAKFAPQIVASSTAVGGLGGQTVAGVGSQGLKLEQYRLFYFTAAVVQGIGDGVLAGLLGSGKVSLGLRHAFLMVLITYVTFALVLA